MKRTNFKITLRNGGHNCDIDPVIKTVRKMPWAHVESVKYLPDRTIEIMVSTALKVMGLYIIDTINEQLEYDMTWKRV